MDVGGVYTTEIYAFIIFKLTENSFGHTSLYRTSYASFFPPLFSFLTFLFVQNLYAKVYF